MPSLTEAPIAVTGATGYIASWVVAELLERGATVHATVRDPSNEKKVGYLKEMAQERPGTLELFAADLLKSGSFAETFEGCAVVIHMASPFLIGKIRDPQKQLVDPALQGTRNVLEQVEQTPSVKRVVLTSSVAAIYGDSIECGERGGVLTEEHWNESSSLEHQPYPYSKTVAEKEAWKIAKAQERWSLVTIHPSFVMGPSLPATRRTGGSQEFMRATIDGTYRMGTLDQMVGWVDVRDVAHAHVEAAARDEASGRYIVSAGEMSFYDAGKLIEQRLDGKVKVPMMALPKWASYVAGPLNGFSWKYVHRNVGHRLRFDTHRGKEELGLSYRPIADTLVEHAEQVLAQP